MALTGNCRGGDSVYATAYPYNPSKNNGDGGGCNGGEGGGEGGGNGSGGGGGGDSNGGSGSGAGGSGASPGSSCANSKGAGFAGDPINTATGNKYLQDNDHLASRWLTFRRFYNSNSAVASTAMGSHWRHSFDRSLEILGSPATQIVMFRPDGKQETFTKANGAWTTTPDNPNQLVESDDAQGAATGYTVFISALRQFETYDTNGLLQTATNESGIGITLTYSTTLTDPSIAPTPGLLLTVAGPKGRQLHFTYTSTGELHQITLPGAGTLTYAYDASNNLTSVQFPDGHTRQYVYNEPTLTKGTDLPHAMTGMIDATDVRYESTSYDSAGRAVSSSFAGNVGTTDITYNADGTSTVTYPLGHSATLGFTTINGLMRVASLDHACDPQCAQPWANRSYDANGYPSSYTDFKDNVTDTAYDSTGLLTQTVDAVGTPSQRTINTTWNTTLNVPLQRSVSNAGGTAIERTAWVYNTDGQPLARCAVDPAQAANYSCAASGTTPTGVRRWTYTYCDAVDATQCPLVGLRLSATGPRTDLTQTTTYRYYMSSSAASCGTPGANCRQPGDLYQVTDALGHVTTYASYDAAGRITRIVDPNGVDTDFTYTPRGWLASRSMANSTTTFTYWPYGAVKSVTDPDGVTTTFSYDSAHRLTRVTDAQGNYRQYALDAAGNRTAEHTYTTSGTLTRTMSRQFNQLGQLLKAFNAQGQATTYAYDVNGNVTDHTDPLGVVTHHGYDALDRLATTLRDYNGSDPATANATTGYTYNARDQIKTVTDPGGLTTTYTYDGLGNLTQLDSPDTGTTTYAYDAAGNRIQQIDARSVEADYTYDALNRLTAIHYPSDSTLDVAYTYDAAPSACASTYPVGHISTMTDASGSTTYCYDRHGNVSAKYQVIAGHALAMHYTHDLADHLQSVDYGTDGSIIQYGRDANGRIDTIRTRHSGPGEHGGIGWSPLVTNIDYLPFGPASTYTFASGGTLAKTYDQDYRISDVIGSATTTGDALNLHFATDTMGNVVAEGPQSGVPAPDESYGYDASNRLAAVSSATQPSRSFTYNATGDRLSDTVTGDAAKLYTYAPSTHHLTDVDGRARSVDAAGDTTHIDGLDRIPGISLTYNDAGRLASMMPSIVSKTTAYTYNGLGQRVSKRAVLLPYGEGQPTGRTVYTYLDDGRLAAEYRGHWTCAIEIGDPPAPGPSPMVTLPPIGGQDNHCANGSGVYVEKLTLVHQYVWADAALVVVSDGTPSATTWRDVYTDHLGTPRAITDQTGAVIWRWSWTNNAFGEATAQTDPDGDGVDFDFNLRYPGQYFDAESGLHYNYFRDYEPGTGRYLESDPIGLNGGPSAYGYVGGNSMEFSDQFGLIKLPNTPSGLPSNWRPDTSHRDPNGERWTNGTDELDFHKGRPGKPGWRGKDHWHLDGGDKHYSPGDQCPTTGDSPPTDDEKFMEKMSKITGLTGTALIVYLIVSEGSRVFPPRNFVPVP